MQIHNLVLTSAEIIATLISIVFMLRGGCVHWNRA